MANRRRSAKAGEGFRVEGEALGARRHRSHVGRPRKEDAPFVGGFAITQAFIIGAVILLAGLTVLVGYSVWNDRDRD